MGVIEETISLLVRSPRFLLCLATGLCFAFAFLVRHVCGIGVPVIISGSACLLNRADCDCFWFCLSAESGFLSTVAVLCACWSNFLCVWFCLTAESGLYVLCLVHIVWRIGSVAFSRCACLYLSTSPVLCQSANSAARYVETFLLAALLQHLLVFCTHI